jgi:xanthine dehydrogenase iron-sulfur cluster and FAD-binding subunit A
VHDLQRRGQHIDRYEAPATPDEAIAALERHGPVARPVAGGTDLLLELERGTRPGVEVLVDLTRIPGLDRIEVVGDRLRLGGLVTHNQVLASAAVVEHALPLAQACLEVGSPALRNRATVAGNLVTASPANDTISALWALDARVVLRSVRGERVVPVRQLFTGLRQTVIEPGELIVCLEVPTMPANARGVFVKLGQRRAQAISVVHLALVVVRDGDGTDAEVTHASLALGSVAPTVVSASAAEDRLVGSALDDRSIHEAAALAAAGVTPIDDVRATADYRNEELGEMVRRALVAVRDGRERDRWPSRLVFLGGPNVPVDGAGPPGGVVDATRVACTVNDEPVRAAGAVGVTLLDWLRDEVGLTGTKEGCAEGECGACTVHLDGVAVLSCLVPAARAHGAAVTTIEGLATGDLHRLQQAFVDQFAVQCGYCIPGFLMSGDRLLRECQRPTREDTAFGLSGNLCRCTGYYRFYDAVEQAAGARW